MSVLVGESVPPGEKGISTYVERCALLYSSPLYGSHALQYLVTYVLLTGIFLLPAVVGVRVLRRPRQRGALGRFPGRALPLRLRGLHTAQPFSEGGAAARGGVRREERGTDRLLSGAQRVKS